MKSVCVDWRLIKSVDDFYEVALSQADAPSWHGRNLDTLNDSWVNGDICGDGPPFSFEFKNSDSAGHLSREFIHKVEAIAAASVREHGGALIFGHHAVG